jgi:hypothetical protein
MRRDGGEMSTVRRLKTEGQPGRVELVGYVDRYGDLPGAVEHVAIGRNCERSSVRPCREGGSVTPKRVPCR